MKILSLGVSGTFEIPKILNLVKLKRKSTTQRYGVTLSLFLIAKILKFLLTRPSLEVYRHTRFLYE